MTEEAFYALVTNTLALELNKPSNPHQPHLLRKGGTTCHFQAGTLMVSNGSEPSLYIPIHLALTGTYALMMDAENEDILCDFLFPQDIYMIIPPKQALMIQMDQTFVLLRFQDPQLFVHWIQKIPEPKRQAAIQIFYAQKEREAHVSH